MARSPVPRTRERDGPEPVDSVARRLPPLLALPLIALLGIAGCGRDPELAALDLRVSQLDRRLEKMDSALREAGRLSALEAETAVMALDARREQPIDGIPFGPSPSRPGEARRVSAPRHAAPPLLGANGGQYPTASPAPFGPSPSRPEVYGDGRHEGGVLRQALPTDPPHLDPAHDTDTTSWRVAVNLFEGLLELDPDDLSLAPLLARTWTISADGLVYTFRLKEGVRFHNGRQCTAEDFVFSFRRLLDPATASERAWVFEQVLGYGPFAALQGARGLLETVADGRFDQVETDRIARVVKQLDGVSAGEVARAGLGERVLELVRESREALRPIEEAGGRTALETAEVPASLLAELRGLDVARFVARGLSAPEELMLRIELARPFAPFGGLLTLANCAVVPREEVERWGDDFQGHPVGTGPFRFAGWKPHVSIELEAFDGYHGGRPALDRVLYRVLPDPTARLYEFEIGNLDTLLSIPDEKYAEIRSDPDFPGVLEEMDTFSTYFIGFNVTRSPLDDPRVRRALNHAVRKDVILDVIRRGRGTVAPGVLPPGIPGHDPGLEGYGYDPARARELLAEAGYPDPAGLGTLELWYNATSPNDPNAQLAEVIQQNLRELGIMVKLSSMDWGTYLSKLALGEAPMFRLAWVAVFPDPDNFLYPLFHSSMRGGSGNKTFYANARVDDLLERGRIVQDMADRVPLYREAERLVVEDAVWIPLFHARAAFLRKKNVRGLRLTPVGPDAMTLRNVWLESGDEAPAPSR